MDNYQVTQIKQENKNNKIVRAEHRMSGNPEDVREMKKDILFMKLRELDERVDNLIKRAKEQEIKIPMI